MRTLIVGVIALALVGCVTSPGRDCTTQEAVQQGKDLQAAQSAADTGVDVTGKQLMQDTVPAKPNTNVARGEGDLNSEAYWDENRAQAGAPVTYQGVVNFFPAAAESTNSSGTGIHPQIASLAKQIENSESRLTLLLSQGNSEEAAKERAHLVELNKQLATASVATKNEINLKVEMPDNYSTLGVASSAGANSKPGATKATEEGATTQDVPKALKSSGVIPAAETPDSLREPPAGAVTETPSEQPTDGDTDG